MTCRGFIWWRAVQSLLLLAVTVLVGCDSPSTRSVIEVKQAFMYELPPGQTRSAIYMTLKNTGEESLSLLGASTSIAGATEIHHTVHEDGMMKMRELKHLQLRPMDVIHFEPGGMHVMLFDVQPAPQVGDKVALILEFDGDTVTVPVRVRKIE